MSSYKIGFIGCGNMGFALARAASRKIMPWDIILSGKDIKKAEERAVNLGSEFGTLQEVAESSYFIMLGIKPQNLSEVKDELKKVLSERIGKFCVVSALAGVSLKTLKEALGDIPIIRIMPNTPVALGKGMTLLTSNEKGREFTEEFKSLMEKSGKIDEIDEALIDDATAISGCGPAFCYMFIDALTQGGIKRGIPEEKALFYAVETAIGAGCMVAEGTESPNELKDRVTSPGGSTIEGVKALLEAGFEEAIVEAVRKSAERTKELGN